MRSFAQAVAMILTLHAVQGGEIVAEAQSQIAVVGVTVLDVASGAAIDDQTVLVHGDRIERVGSRAEVMVPSTATVVDGDGLFLMPGLVDAHVHYFDSKTFSPLLIANGVTLVRDTGMANELVLPIRDDLERGHLLGPELRTAGTILDGTPPLIPVIARGVATPEEARAAVRQQAAAGVDFIKVYSRLAADAFLAILDEARTLGLRVAGHVPDSITIEAAAEAGLDVERALLRIRQAHRPAPRRPRQALLRRDGDRHRLLPATR